MKREKTLRQKLTPFFFLAVAIPIVIFACLSMYRLERSIRASLDRQIAGNLNKADQCLDMVLDKYGTLLYDLCTDDEVITLVEEINRNQDGLEVNSNDLRRELSHICNRNSGIEGITVITAEGRTIYYDHLSASSVSSTWVSEITAPAITKGAAYEGITEPVSYGKESVYMLRIARRLVDYEDIHKEVGTVVMSINEDLLTEALDAWDIAENYLVSGKLIISAPDNKDIGKTVDEIREDEYEYTSVVNERTGFTIYNRQSLRAYHDTFYEQGIFWLLITAAAVGVVFILVYVLTRPYLKEIDTIAEAMNEVEQGNFRTEVAVNDKMPLEIRKISNGFNEMVKHIEMLIEQVKAAILEQKNAELSALEAQIDPHFLYNTLDTINWKAIERGEFEISEMVGALADILRYTVKNAGGETSIEQELYWLRQYIILQSAKAGKEILVQLDVPDSLRGCRIHKLLLQPFVENAIKHGMKRKEGECRIDISMRSTENQIHIIIADNGTGIDASTLGGLNSRELENDTEYAGNHLGITNVRKRLRLYYGEQADIYFESRPGSYTKVHLFIPAVPAGEGGTRS